MALLLTSGIECQKFNHSSSGAICERGDSTVVGTLGVKKGERDRGCGTMYRVADSSAFGMQRAYILDESRRMQENHLAGNNQM